MKHRYSVADPHHWICEQLVGIARWKLILRRPGKQSENNENSLTMLRINTPGYFSHIAKIPALLKVMNENS